MDYEKIIDKLKEYKKQLEELRSQHHTKGRDNRILIHDKILMFIRRIYPNPKEIEKKFFTFLVIGTDDDNYYQEQYLKMIKRDLGAIDMMTSELEIFGFKDFEPIKEKTETEVKVGLKNSFWRRKKNK